MLGLIYAGIASGSEKVKNYAEVIYGWSLIAFSLFPK